MIEFKKRNSGRAQGDCPVMVTAYGRKDDPAVVHLQLKLHSDLMRESGWRHGDAAIVRFDDGTWTLSRTLNRSEGFLVSRPHKGGAAGSIKITANRSTLDELGLKIKHARRCVVVDRSEQRITVRYE